MELSAVLLQLISEFLSASRWGWALFHTQLVQGLLNYLEILL